MLNQQVAGKPARGTCPFARAGMSSSQQLNFAGCVSDCPLFLAMPDGKSGLCAIAVIALSAAKDSKIVLGAHVVKA